MVLHSFTLSTRWASALLLPAAIVASAPLLKAQAEEDSSYMGENPDRYASVRTLEGEATIQKGEVEETLSRGVPVAEGDVVESHGRGVLQLADGTRVAFGPDTRFQVATLFLDKDQDRQVLLRLDYGRLRVSMGREKGVQLRVDMPSGSALLSDGSSVGLAMERDRTARVKVLSGRMVFLNERDQLSLLAGERLTVYSAQDRLDRVQNFNTLGGDSFDAWCERNLEVRRGPSWEKVPPEIRYYTDDLDDNGEWVYVDEAQSWCWRPLRVSAEWRPYWRGRWGAYPGGMTWISDEPWGYVTYHHGRWGWGAGFGWYWIPGVNYSPAWVAWQSSDAYLGWAPMGYHNRPATWGYGAWGGGYCWNVVDINFIHADHIHTHTHQDPGVIHAFNPGNGPGGIRTLAPPWHQGPLVVSQNEFRNPAQMQRFLQDPHAAENRLHTYEQQSGRTLYRRPWNNTASPQGPASFEDRSHLPPPSSHRTAPGTIPQDQPIHPNVPKNSAPSQPPFVQPPTGHPSKILPREQPIQPHGATPPGFIPPPLTQPSHGHPGKTTPREQAIQPRNTPRSDQGPSPDGSQPPPLWLKKNRPLSHP